MNWIVVLAIAVISDALRIFIDNYVADYYFKEKDSVAQKIISGLVLSIAGIVTLFLNGFDPTQILPLTIVLLMLSGIFSSLAGIPYFKALEIDDSTNIGIFFQFSPILYLFYSWIFTGEPFNLRHLIGALIILLAPFIIVVSARKRSRKTRIKAAFFAFISILFYVASGALFVQADSTELNLFSEIGLTLIFKGISDVIIIGGRTKWRRRLTKVIKSSRGKVLGPINAGVAMRLIQEFSYRIGLVIAPSVAIASAASDSTEPIVIFFLGLVLTLIWPKFGREKLQKKVVLVHLIATILVIVGIVFMQM